MISREPGQDAARAAPQVRLKVILWAGMTVGDGRGDPGQVVDEQAVRDTAPATLEVIGEDPGDAGLQRREQRVMTGRDQLDALEVTEDGLYGQPVGIPPTRTFCRCGSNTTPWPKSACITGGATLRR